MLQEAKTAKTYPEIWATLSEDQRLELRRRIVIALGVGDSTMRNWNLGLTRPVNAMQRAGLAEALSNTLKKRYTSEDLFPAKTESK